MTWDNYKLFKPATYRGVIECVLIIKEAGEYRLIQAKHFPDSRQFFYKSDWLDNKVVLWWRELKD